MRLDQFLVTENLVPTRSQARNLIKDGHVLIDHQRAKKPGQEVTSDSQITITRKLFVSRSAHKLEAAIKQFEIDPKDKVCADIGASTGGFTQVLLENNAQKIYAIDVGQNQLAEQLRNDDRVINLEKTNIRENLELPEKVDLCVVDLSFISLRLTLPPISELLKPEGDIIALIKPQFEGGKNAVNEKGIISSIKKAWEIRDNLLKWCKKNGFQVIDHTDSPIKGKNGNNEFLVHLKLAKDETT